MNDKLLEFGKLLGIWTGGMLAITALSAVAYYGALWLAAILLLGGIPVICALLFPNAEWWR